MFMREMKNSSGSSSIQIISKAHGVYKVIKTIGSAITLHEITALKIQARQEKERLEGQRSLFVSKQD